MVRNLPTKKGSGFLPLDTATLEGPRGEIVKLNTSDELTAIPKLCLPRHIQNIRRCIK